MENVCTVTQIRLGEGGGGGYHLGGGGGSANREPGSYDPVYIYIYITNLKAGGGVKLQGLGMRA